MLGAAGVVLLAGIVAYGNSLGGPFVFDDVLAITGNPTLRRFFSWAIFQPPVGLGLTVEGRPLLNASFAFNHAISGLDVGSYHALNLAIHLLAGLALLGVVHRTLRLPLFSHPWREHALSLGLVVALVWTLHPVQTAAVTYVVQRAESLMGALVLLTLYAFVRGAAPGGDSRWFALAVLGAWLGAFAKEVAAVAPVFALLHDRTFIAGSFRAAWQARGRVHLAMLSSWVPIAGLVLGSGSRGGTVGFGSNVAWQDYALTQFDALARYLGLAAWPHPLVFDYGTAWVHSAGEIVPAIVVVLAMIGGTLVALWRWPAWGFLGVVFFGPLAPTSLVPGNRQTMAEHRMYLPLAACAVAGVVVVFLLGRRSPRAWRWSLVTFAVIALGWLTWQRNVTYASELRLYRDTVAKRPDNAFARYNLGKCLAESGAPAAAIPEYRAAIRLKPDLVIACYNLGNALNDLGRADEAEAAYRAALRLEPRHARSHYNLGNLLVRLGRREEALEHFAQAADLAPEFLDAQLNLGGVLLELGRIDEARRQFERVLERDPNSPAAHLNLGHVHLLQGRPSAARREYEIALQLVPDFAPAQAALRRLPGQL